MPVLSPVDPSEPVADPQSALPEEAPGEDLLHDQETGEGIWLTTPAPHPRIEVDAGYTPVSDCSRCTSIPIPTEVLQLRATNVFPMDTTDGATKTGSRTVSGDV